MGAVLLAATLGPIGAASAYGATGSAHPGVQVAAVGSSPASSLEPRADPFSDDPANGRGFILLAGLTVAVVAIGALFARSVRRAQSQRDPSSPYYQAEADARSGSRAKSADGP